MKVRIIKDHKEYRKDEVVDVTPNVAHGLIDSGVARADRMFTSYKTATRGLKNGKSA